MDSNGEKISSTEFKGEGYYLNRLFKLNNDKLFLLGRKTNIDLTHRFSFLYQYDSNDKVMDYIGDIDYDVNDIKLLNNGNVLILGEMDGRTYINKISSSGETIESIIIPNRGQGVATNLEKINNNLYVAYNERAYAFFDKDLNIIK